MVDREHDVLDAGAQLEVTLGLDDRSSSTREHLDPAKIAIQLFVVGTVDRNHQGDGADDSISGSSEFASFERVVELGANEPVVVFTDVVRDPIP